MKKTLLFAVSVLFCVVVIGQQQITPKSDLRTHQAPGFDHLDKQAIKVVKENPQHVKPTKPANSENDSEDFVNIISIGTSANSYGYGYNGGAMSLVCVNQELNTVTNFHRMGGALDPGGFSGDLGYDISKDGGLTWTNMIEVYTANDSSGGGYFTDAARYPNHGIYNPVGNTDPNEAYVSFFASNSAGSPGNSGYGYLHGRGNIGNPDDTTSNYIPADTAAGIFPYLPEGYTLTNLGEFWAVDLNQDWSGGTVVFLEEMILNRGIWNEGIEDFEVIQSLLPCETQDAQRPVCQRVEFSPDGQVGYIAVLTDNGMVPISQERSLFPILWKTTDAGDTWTGPMPVAIAGPRGITAVHSFLSDDELAELYGAPIPDREEIEFTTAYDFDLSVDAWGNPQIAVICGITGTDAYSIVTSMSEVSGYIFTAAFLISSMDGGENFFAYELGRQKTFRGTFGDLTEDNRIQIARTHAGDKMFVSWLDTDIPGVTGNQQPDIYARGIDIVFDQVTHNNGEMVPDNVTEYSEGMWQAYFFAMGNEIFDENAVYTIPYVYQQMNPEDPAEQVQFKYIQDFYFTEEDFWVGIDEHIDPQIKISQNFPNPASHIATVNIWLNEPSVLDFKVTNLIGQKVYEIPTRKYGQGMSSVSFDVSGLPGGVYIYTVDSGESRISKRMIVE